MKNQNASDNPTPATQPETRVIRATTTAADAWNQIVWGVLITIGFLITQGFMLYWEGAGWWYFILWIGIMALSLIITVIQFSSEKSKSDTQPAEAKSDSLWSYLAQLLIIIPLAFIVQSLVNQEYQIMNAAPTAGMAILALGACYSGIQNKSLYLKIVAVAGYIFMFVIAVFPFFFGIIFAVMMILLCVISPIIRLRKIKGASTSQ